MEKKKNYLIFMVMIVSLFCASNVFASWSFDLSFVDEDTVNLTFLSDEGDVSSIPSYSLFIGYESTIDITSFTVYQPSGYSAAMGPAVDTPADDSAGTPNMISNITAMTFGGGVLTDGFVIASFDISYSSDLKKDGKQDIYFYYTYGNFGVNDQNYNTTYGEELLSNGNLTYDPESLDVGSAIPVPSSFLLLGGGIIALLRINNRKRS